MNLKEIYFLPISIINKIIIYRKNVEVKEKIKINGLLRIYGSGKISIDKNVTINSSRLANPSAGNESRFYVIKDAELIIGKNTGISNSVFCCTKEINIGENVTIGAGSHFYDTDFHPINYLDRRNKNNNKIKSEKITIENDVFIGANCMILKGVTIGERSVIGAGSVVSKSIPKGELWAGNPIKFIRKLID